jgi:predicted DCC family thiol-disulfide oxidoreductase YuxK
MATSPSHEVIVLFDGVCNLCNASVNFLIKRDRKSVFRYATQQSEIGRQLLQTHGVEPDTSVVVIDAGRAYLRSSGWLRLARHLPFPWRLGVLLWIIPRPLCDWMYGVIARNRYRWYGRSDTCRVPTAAELAKFL